MQEQKKPPADRGLSKRSGCASSAQHWADYGRLISPSNSPLSSARVGH